MHLLTVVCRHGECATRRQWCWRGTSAVGAFDSEQVAAAPIYLLRGRCQANRARRENVAYLVDALTNIVAATWAERRLMKPRILRPDMLTCWWDALSGEHWGLSGLLVMWGKGGLDGADDKAASSYLGQTSQRTRSACRDRCRSADGLADLALS